MSEPQFTPGPWQSKHDFSKEGVCTIIANVDGDQHADGSTTYSFDFICTCEDEFGEYTECAEANARLIRTSPELYEALFGLVSAVATTAMPEAACERLLPFAMKAKAALDKAAKR